MAEIKCPSCGSPNVEQIDTDKYQCPYCGKTFSSTPIKQAAKIISIHGYTQWFAVNPDVKVSINGQQVGKVARGGLLQIQIDTPCQLKFDCNMRSAKIDVNPDVDTDIYISCDRISGCLLANKSNSTNGVIEENHGGKIDKPSILLDILSFLIPIAGLILYFVKRREYPNSAKAYLTCAICGFVLGFIFNLAQ